MIQPQGKELDLLTIILSDNDGSLYDAIVITGDQKQICETGLGLVSQCYLTKHVFRMSKQYLTNVGGRDTVLVDVLSRRIPLVVATQDWLEENEYPHRMGVLRASSPGWGGAPGLAKSLVKKVVRLDVPVDKYPSRKGLGCGCGGPTLAMKSLGTGVIEVERRRWVEMPRTEGRNKLALGSGTQSKN
ncbi:hypothetical protein ZIOFF_018782 [Zingiber officinale]|uniref:Uncharacterized protein n=1 Tax=Zingiber officinale TaxID=94328 RepID=A0A8J5HQR7_ZINOF|nr:hypothetical protein ZIOFF_018782 [Zingiber officinale]